MLDRYVFTIIYKDCSNDGDTRKFYTAINWLFTAEEADEFFADDFRLNFSKCIMHSQNILIKNGYRFPENPPIHLQETVFSSDLQTALASASFYADLFAAQDYRRLQTQTFVALNREEGLFNALFGALDLRPKKMRKHLSFCIGAFSASETYGVALVLMYNDVLAPIVTSGNLNGAMAVNKLFFIKNSFKTGSQIPPKAKAFVELPENYRTAAKEFFDDSQDSANYWNLIDAFASNDINRFKGASLVKLIGTDGFMKQYKKGAFSTEDLVSIYKNRDEIFDMPAVIELLRSLPDVVEIAEKELATEKSAAEQESLNVSDTKKKRSLFGKRNKKTKAKEQPKPLTELVDDIIETEPEKASDDSDLINVENLVETQPLVEDKFDEDTSSREGKHSAKRERGKKAKNLLKFFAYIKEDIVPIFIPFIILLFAIIFGVAMYFIGINIIPVLPEFLGRLVYGLQITVLVLVSLLCGCIIKGKLEKYINNEKLKKRSARKED